MDGIFNLLDDIQRKDTDSYYDCSTYAKNFFPKLKPFGIRALIVFDGDHDDFSGRSYDGFPRVSCRYIYRSTMCEVSLSDRVVMSFGKFNIIAVFDLGQELPWEKYLTDPAQ